MMTRQCDYCGKTFRTFNCYEKRNNCHRFCSKECEGKFRNYNNTIEHWTGGHINKSNGYKYVRFDGKQIDSVAMHFRLEELVMLETIIDEWENYKEKPV